ncbi:hypothetical protein [Streptomyces sp. NPDC016626]|uniref:hypothetical protein n=1 Tax=Streptomyces sp. NPDC016626 TaxID=3364968 RepID=UPI00370023D5
MTSAPPTARLGVPSGSLFLPVTAYGPGCRAIGVPLRSSAALHSAPGTAPGTALARTAFRTGGDATAHRLVDNLRRPCAEPRTRGGGRAVSPVEAAVRLRGPAVGEGRPAQPYRDHVGQLARVVERGSALIEEDR